jgi:hypothetical protein
MLTFNNNVQLEITDKIKFNNCSNTEPLHLQKLDYYNGCVQQVIEKFNDKDPILVYNKCRVYYWFFCNNIEEFEKNIKDKLNRMNNINDLF